MVIARISGENGKFINYGYDALTIDLEADKKYVLSVEYQNGVCLHFSSFTLNQCNDRIIVMTGNIRNDSRGRKIMRYFNTEGLCRPEEHYMVRLDDRLSQIKKRYIDRRKYFVINRGRQYGKTTTLVALAEYLKEDYVVFSMDFQGIGTEEFVSAETFAYAFAKEMLAAADDTVNEALLKPLIEFAESATNKSLRELFVRLSRICAESEKPVVLMIDEVDSASNNQVFIDFLAQLRKYYLDRERHPIFHSVILAGVYDIKNLKLKIRPEEEHQYNSPWNIAADFDIEMSFSAEQIVDMLKEYETDYQTGMEIVEVSNEIYHYTSGYPYLVSRICKVLDEKIPRICGFEKFGSAWTKEGIAESVKILLKENTPLFDSMIKQLDLYKDLRNMIEEIIYQGKKIPYSLQAKPINLGMMFGFLEEKNGSVVIANRIFEMVLLNMFIAEEAIRSTAFQYGERDRNQFTKGGMLNMDLVLEKFVEHFHDIYGGNDEKFVEEHGRKFFLLYLKPIINGTGNYYVEAQTRDARRMDVIVDYLGEQFVVELKIWHGNEYNERGEEQLIGYLDYFHRKKGYLLSFNFNKKKEVGVKELRIGSKTIIEAVV